MKYINYVSTHKVWDTYSTISPYSHFNVDGVSFDIETVLHNTDQQNIYTDCPIWTHKANRTFIVRSPVDIEFEYINDENDTYIKLSDKNYFRDPNLLFLETRGEKNWIGTGNPVLQLSVPTYLFWTKEKNIWIEISSYPYTSVKNNYVIIGGWWNLSKWTRPTSFGLQIVDTSKPVIIKRGDPIYQICFYSNDFNDSFKVIKQEEIPDNIMKKVSQTVHIKTIINNLSTKLLFSKQKESKCPFSFLFNK